jgi:succinoglycan biosynthesis transport protein ExoP
MSPYQPLSSYAPSRQGPAYAPPPLYAQSFQLADLIRLIDARRHLILRVALATILCALAVALALPTTYSSSAVVMLDTRKNNITDISAVLSQLPTDPTSLQNQIQILQSRELAATVVDRLKLYDDPEFNPALNQTSLLDFGGHALSLLNPKNWIGNGAPNPVGRDRVIDTFLKHVGADAQGLSTAITITANSRDASKAALIANTMADVYVKSQVTAKVGATAATTGWLNNRLQELAGQLQNQEEAVQRYKAQNGLADSAPGNSLVDQQMAAINAQVVAARSELAEKEAILDRVNGSNPAEVTQVASSPVIVQLRGQQAQLLAEEGSLSSKYGPLHPRMQAIQEQKRDLDFKITQEVNRLSASSANDVTMARAHLNSLLGSLGGTERIATGQNMARVQLQALQSNATSTRAMYEAFIQRLRQSQNTDEAQLPDSHVISSASVPPYPSGPKRTLIVGASIPVGLLLGLLAALVTEKLGPLMPVRVNGAPRAAIVPPVKKSRRAASTPVAVWSGPPVLGEINDPAQLRAADFVLDYPASRYAHAMASLVRQLQSPAGSGNAAVVAVTSADTGENSSAIAVSLARAASKMGKKAIIVDCAPARLATKAMKVPIRNGLYEVLTGAVPLNQALARDPRGDVYLLGSLRRPPNSETMYASRPMAKLMSVLRGGADFVVIDCGPANAGPDAALIARLADATVLVSPRQALHSPMVSNAARILQSAQAAPIGMVITG